MCESLFAMRRAKPERAHSEVFTSRMLATCMVLAVYRASAMRGPERVNNRGERFSFGGPND